MNQIQDIDKALAEIDAMPADVPSTPEPFDLSGAGVGPMLETDPPPRLWLVKDRLPLGVVGLLAAAGGTGKSMAVLQLAVSVATGLPWLRLDMGLPGSVLILSAEDDRDEIHRRLHAVARHYRNTLPLGDWDDYADLIRERVKVLDRVGEDNRLTIQVDRKIIRTDVAARIVETVRTFTDCRLIVLDPLARFDGGDPNDNADATRLIECAEFVRRETGATVLLPHHVAKGKSGAGQEAVRGASALVDGARWVGLLATMRPEEAKQYRANPDDAGRFVHFSTPKGNYSAPWSGLWLERGTGGVLMPSAITLHADTDKAAKADAEYQDILARVADLIRKHGPMPKRRISDDYAGTVGVLQASHSKVRATLSRAIESGDLIEMPGGVGVPDSEPF
jgi:RecA-family ATPase